MMIFAISLLLERKIVFTKVFDDFYSTVWCGCILCNVQSRCKQTYSLSLRFRANKRKGPIIKDVLFGPQLFTNDETILLHFYREKCRTLVQKN